MEKGTGPCRSSFSTGDLLPSHVLCSYRNIFNGKIYGLSCRGAVCSSDGLCLPNTCTSSSNCSPVWIQLNDSGWLSGSGSSKSVAYGSQTSAAALPGFSAQPRYIVEALSTTTAAPSAKVSPGGSLTTTLYRVTAVGFGLNTKTRVMLQSTVRPNK